MPEIKNMKELPFGEDRSASKSAALARTAAIAETADDLINWDTLNGNNGHEGQNGRKGHNGHLTSGRLLAKNTIWNLLGSGAPMVVAVFCIPILIRGLGTDRFGVLTLAWALIGYASLFDLGLGRALTQLVARKLGAGEEQKIPALVWTSLLLMLLLGVLAAGTVSVLSPWLVHHALNVPGILQRETLQSFYLLGLSLPVVISTAGLRGLLEAHQRFDLINGLRVPMGLFTFVGPLLVLPFSHGLVPVVAALVAGRLIAWVGHMLLCLRVAPELRRSIVWEHSVVASLLRFGGWMTIANVVNPALVLMDRFLIGALLPVAMLSYYTAPFEAVTKLWIIPVSLTATVFPACSALGPNKKKELQHLYSRSVKYLLLVLAPISLGLALFARQILEIWLGQDFAARSDVVLQVLAVGVFINCFAHVPYCFLQGLGRPDATAKLLLAELVPYSAFAFWMIKKEGIVGAAAAWSIRAALEVLLLVLMAWHCCSLSPRSLFDRGLLRSFAALFALGVAMLATRTAMQTSLGAEVSITGAWLIGFLLVTWKYVLDDSDRVSIANIFAMLRMAVRNRGVA